MMMINYLSIRKSLFKSVYSHVGISIFFYKYKPPKNRYKKNLPSILSIFCRVLEDSGDMYLRMYFNYDVETH